MNKVAGPTSHHPSIRKILPVLRAGFPETGGNGERLESLRDVDWPLIARFSAQHRIVPILYHNLKKCGAVGMLPEDVKRFLHENYMRIAGNNMRMARRLTDLCGLFEENGIVAVPYKGPVLAQVLYGDSALRYCQDLDVLVSHGQLRAVWQVLAGAGYRPFELPLTEEGFLVFARHGKECEFIDAGGTVALDLHWKIARHTRCAFDMDFCAPRLKRVFLHDRSVWRLSDEDMVLALCLNSGRDMWPHMESVLVLADILAASRGLDWGVLADLARRLRCERELLLGLFLAADIFEVRLPESFRGKMALDRSLRKLANRAYKGMFEGRKPIDARAGNFNHLLWQMRLKGHGADKIRYLLRRFFVPTQKDWKTWPGHANNLFLLSFLRPVGYIRKSWRSVNRYEE